MKTLTGGQSTYLDQDSSFQCVAIKLTFRNGTVKRITNNSVKTKVLEGVTLFDYLPYDFEMSSITNSGGDFMGSVSLMVNLIPAGVSLDALNRKVLTDAEVLIYDVLSGDTALPPILLFNGIITSHTVSKSGTVAAEINDRRAYDNLIGGKRYQARCRAVFGDTRCGVDLTP
jgi:hypothetical protein